MMTIWQGYQEILLKRGFPRERIQVLEKILEKDDSSTLTFRTSQPKFDPALSLSHFVCDLKSIN